MFKLRTSKYRHVFCDQPKPEVSNRMIKGRGSGSVLLRSSGAPCKSSCGCCNDR